MITTNSVISLSLMRLITFFDDYIIDQPPIRALLPIRYSAPRLSLSLEIVFPCLQREI